MYFLCPVFFSLSLLESHIFSYHKFPSDAELCGVIDMLEGRDSIQRDLERERWPMARS